MIKIAQGAEAVLYHDRGEIIKERLSKAYRLPQLDDSLRKFRTRREAKILQKLEELNFPAPRLRDFSDQRMSIVMDFVAGEQLKDVLAQGMESENIINQIGQQIAQLHNHHIIHGDLTASNMILSEGKLNLIDFGLSFFSEKAEDKAVDLFALERGLKSMHPEVLDKILHSYNEAYPEAGKVLERLKEVRKRGRNKNK